MQEKYAHYYDIYIYYVQIQLNRINNETHQSAFLSD